MDNQWKAVIGVLNSQYIHSSLAPWCLLAGVQTYAQEGVCATVVEGTINEPLEAVAERIVSKSPQAVGLSCYIWNITQTARLLELIHAALPDCVLVLGGPEVSYCADKVMHERPLVDYIVSGEGEKPFALLLNALAAGRSAEQENIPGLCYRAGDRVVVSPPYTPNEQPPSPYTPAYFEALKGRIAYFESSRGCPYSCAFCLSGRCGNVRFFNQEQAERELLLLANSGTRTVKFVDRTFNADRGRANRFFRYIIAHYGKEIPSGVCFHFEIAGDLLDEETLALLAHAPAGCMQLEIGLQSFHAPTLEAIHRRTNVERLKANIRRLLANGNMHIHIDLIAGLPLEDRHTFAHSFNTAYALQPHMLQLGFLKLLYGAPMREKEQEYPCFYSDQPPYEVTRTPWLSEQDLRQLHEAEDPLQRLYNSGRFRRTLRYLLEALEISAFDLLCSFGEHCAALPMQGISLNAYTRIVYEYFSAQSGVDKGRLRDVMVCDRLATNASGLLPEVLRIKDGAFKNGLRRLQSDPSLCPREGVRRSFARLYSENAIVYAEYGSPHPVTGEYPLCKVPMGRRTW